jgi:hypothetical protein
MMSDGSPMLAAERGDAIDMPDVLFVQATGDNLHPRHCMERFVAAYNKRGGYAEPLLIEGDPYDFLRTKPDTPEARRAMKRMIEFIHERTDAAQASMSRSAAR